MKIQTLTTLEINTAKTVVRCVYEIFRDFRFRCKQKAKRVLLG